MRLKCVYACVISWFMLCWIHLHSFSVLSQFKSRPKFQFTKSLHIYMSEVQGSNSNTSPVESIVNIPLRLISKGVAAPVSETIKAQELWKTTPTLIFVARRPGCVLCRENAIDLAEKFQAGDYPGVNFVSIIKEVAPSGKVLTDKELGVEEYQEKYMLNYPVYLDETKQFYNFLGNRNFFSQKLSSWNPFTLYSDFQAVRNRVNAKNLNGNYAGDYSQLGGAILVSPTKGVTYICYERTGFVLPMDEIEAAINALDKKE